MWAKLSSIRRETAIVFRESTPVGAGQVRELRARRVEGERDEALEAARLVLLLAQTDEMVDAVFDRFDVAVEHRRVGLQTGRVDLARELEPALRRRVLCAQILERVGSRKISAPPPGHESIPASRELRDHLLVRHLVEAREEIELDHRQRLQVELRELRLERGEQIGVVAKGQLGVQPADDVQLGRALLRRPRPRCAESLRYCACRRRAAGACGRSRRTCSRRSRCWCG